VGQRAIKYKLFPKKGCFFDANLVVRDYRIKGGYVWVWSILDENSRKQLQKLQSLIWASLKGDL